jgi:cell division protein FtsW (lipid II flippase)
MEQKTYWWRILVLLFAGILFSYGYAVLNIEKLEGNNSYIDSFDFASVAFLISSIPLFFVRDEIFLKWFKFSLVWWFFAIILIALTPSSHHSFLNLNPDRESVSLWLSGLFVIVSLTKLVWDTRKLRQNTGQR